MVKVTLPCAFITPAFWGSADQEKPELRPPTLKGFMRFWWRAFHWEWGWEKLRQEENKIFGGPLDERRSLKSPFSLSIEPIKVDTNVFFIPRDKMDKDHQEGLSYLFHFMKGSIVFQKGSTFRILLTFKVGDDKIIQQVLASLWATIHLGGTGSRARRGGGNIIALGEPSGCGSLNLPTFQLPKTSSPDQYLKWFKYQIDKVKNCLGAPKDLASPLKDKYTNASYIRIGVSVERFDDGAQALGDIGKIYKEAKVEKAFFGLPKPNVEILDKDIHRRASPVIFKVTKIGEKYHWLVIRLSGKYLPDNVEIKKDGRSLSNDNPWDAFFKNLKIKCITLPEHGKNG